MMGTKEHTKPPEQLIPAWSLLLVIADRSKTSTPQQREISLEMLDELHDGLLKLIDQVEFVANELQKSL